MPAAYSERVRHALDAEATSVKLSNLVGQGGLWYGFGRLIMNECVLVDWRPYSRLNQ